MPSLRRRIKRLMRKKHKKTIKLSIVDKVWDAYVKHGITEKLVKYGKVVIDKNFSLEIVGEKITDNTKLFALATKNMGIKLHRDCFYKVKVIDKNFKEGTLYFDANKRIKKRMREELENNNAHYRILECQ